MLEIWKDIPGYEDYYQVSNLGNVKSLRKNKIMSPCIAGRGYNHLFLYKDKKASGFLVHRLVLLAFIGYSNLVVNHKNGIKTDNRLENLEYCTYSENEQHAYKTGLKTNVGENHSQSKLTENDVLEIRSLCLNGNLNQTEIAKMFNTNRRHVSSIKNRRIWKHI